MESFENRFDELEKGVLKNEENIKKTVKVSITALKEAKEARKEQKENLKALQTQLDSLKTLSHQMEIAIGIGHDVTRYYQRAVTIVDAEQLGGAMMDKLAELFEEDTDRSMDLSRRVA